jgi:hypothetical protein
MSVSLSFVWVMTCVRHIKGGAKHACLYQGRRLWFESTESCCPFILRLADPEVSDAVGMAVLLQC